MTFGFQLPARLRDKSFNVGNTARQGGSHPLNSLWSDYHIVFDADADALVLLEGRPDGGSEFFIFGRLRQIIQGIHANVYARLVSKSHARFEPRAAADIVDVHSQPVT